ncbi:MAG: hypothetical protein LBT59_10340 [Clostridiales bacterium]|jgi:hypothetical protein|nr:hypothetical protein [Clostridiales bacterium]
MKHLAIALLILTGLAFGVQKSYSWFSSRDETPKKTVEAGGLDVRLELESSNEVYFYPSLFQSPSQRFMLNYHVYNYSKAAAVVKVNQAGVILNGVKPMSAKEDAFQQITFRLYKLTDECFKRIKHISNEPEKYLDYDYLDSIGFVPFDITSPNYEVVPLVFNNYVKEDENAYYYTTTPDIGLRVTPEISGKYGDYFIASGYSSRGFSIDELTPTSQSSNDLYLRIPPAAVDNAGKLYPTGFAMTFEFKVLGKSAVKNPTADKLAPLNNFDNSYMYSVITLDVNQENLTDEFGNNIVGDLNIVAIEDNAGAFRSVFNNYADESLFYSMQPSSNPVTPFPYPAFESFNMTVKHFGSATIPDETFSNLGATPDQYQIISCTDDQETQIVIDKLEKFDVEISSPDCYVEQTGNVISVQLDGDEKPGTVAVIQLLLKESNTCMLTIKVIK